MDICSHPRLQQLHTLIIKHLRISVLQKLCQQIIPPVGWQFHLPAINDKAMSKHFGHLVLTLVIRGHCKSLNIFRKIYGPTYTKVKWKMKNMETQQVKWPHNTFIPEWLRLKSWRGGSFFLGGGRGDNSLNGPLATSLLRFLDQTQLDNHTWYNSSKWVTSSLHTYGTQQTQKTNINPLTRIQTHDCSNRGAADLHFRPHGH